MKGMFKYTAMIVALGVIGSSSAMAASGGLIGNGTGNVTVQGVVSSATCAVNWAKKESSFTLELDKVKAAKPSEVLSTVPQGFTLTGCSGQAVALNLKAGTLSTNENRALPDGLNSSNTPFYIESSFPAVTDITWPSGSSYTANVVMGMNGAGGVVITPTTDSSTYTMNNIVAAGVGAGKAVAGNYNITYTYNFAYK